MTARGVHWHEGMFLRPHHLQTAGRHYSQLVFVNDKWTLHYNWGLRTIDLDRDALANYRFVVRSLQARLRDGTPVLVPEEGEVPVLDLKPVLERELGTMILLAVPTLRLGKANTGANGDPTASRFLIDHLPLEDENTGVNPQEIALRRLNLRLLTGQQDATGYEVLALARVQKSPEAQAVPELDETYIPPVLGCDGWKPLAAGILQAIYDRIGRKLELLADQVGRGITFDSPGQGNRQTLEQLRVLNEAYALLGILVFAEGVHPLPAYLELCRLVGQLAIFGPRRRPPELPKYDHDDLGRCFYAVKRYLDELLDVVVEPIYKEVPFVGAGLRMQVALQPAWLESIWQTFVGVQTNLPTPECVRLLTVGGLDMKIGSAETVDEIFRLGKAGLRFAHAPTPPQVLPQRPGLVYFQVSRESQLDEWGNVRRTLTLAIRLNENKISGNIQGQQVLTVRLSGTATATMQFTLFLVPPDKPAAPK